MKNDVINSPQPAAMPERITVTLSIPAGWATRVEKHVATLSDEADPRRLPVTKCDVYILSTSGDLK